MSIKVWADGKVRVVGDWYPCAECGEKFYKPPQTRKRCCDNGCQAIRDKRMRRQRYLKQKEENK